MSKEEILYIGNALMWFVISYTPIIIYTTYYTRTLNQTKDDINPIMGAILTNTANRLEGILDEVRISGFQDANYYAQSWYNQNDVSDFVTLLGTI